MESVLVYGAYGYTGRLVVREVLSRGTTPVVAGRTPEQVDALADEYDLEGLTFALSSPRLEEHLRPFDVVLNCAGPFIDTALPLVEACLETGVDYLDVTGELAVFDSLSKMDERARNAGVTLLPGVGFDVVPSDCLAAFLAECLPSADALTLGFSGPDSPSRGTALTILEQFGNGSVVRRDGRLIEVPTGYATREIDFGDGPTPTLSIPMGDLVTAAYSTGIETIEVYGVAPLLAIKTAPLADRFDWLLRSRPVRGALERVVRARVTGPTEDELEHGRAAVWCEVRDPDGRVVRARLRTPNVYAFTADAAVTAVERVLAGEVGSAPSDGPGGFQTPATAFGPDFPLELEGVEREVLDANGL